MREKNVDIGRTRTHELLDQNALSSSQTRSVPRREVNIYANNVESLDEIFSTRKKSYIIENTRRQNILAKDQKCNLDSNVGIWN